MVAVLFSSCCFENVRCSFACSAQASQVPAKQTWLSCRGIVFRYCCALPLMARVSPSCLPWAYVALALSLFCCCRTSTCVCVCTHHTCQGLTAFGFFPFAHMHLFQHTCSHHPFPPREPHLHTWRLRQKQVHRAISHAPPPQESAGARLVPDIDVGVSDVVVLTGTSGHCGCYSAFRCAAFPSCYGCV